MENEMRSLSDDIRLCGKDIRKHYKIILYCMAVGLVLGILLGINVKTNQYVASTKICNASFSSYEQIIAMAQVFKDCGTIATSYSVASRATLILGDSSISPSQIQEMIEVSYDSNASYIATIFCESASPEVSVKVVNAVSDALVMEMNEMTGTECVQILDRASHAEVSSRAIVVRLILMVVMLLVGMLVPMVYFVFRVLFSRKVIAARDCTLDGKLVLLGVIPVAESSLEKD